MKDHNSQPPKLFPIKSEKILRDKLLEKLLHKTQEDISSLADILNDYIFMGTNSLQHPINNKRNKEEFYTDFDIWSGESYSDILNILNSFSTKKQLDDYKVLMKLLDPNAPIDSSWFRYQFLIMHRVFDEYRKKILALKWYKHQYENFNMLEGYTSFLCEMCFDISSLISMYYNLKASEYAKYVDDQRMKEEENPFVNFCCMQKMSKTHKANSRSLFDTSEGVLNRTFYKDDAHVTPVVTFLIRQMIELRLEEYLGIQAIYKDRERTTIKKIVGSDYFDLPLLQCSSVFPIPLDIIRRIYRWASGYVHHGISDECWIIYYVRNYLSDFICGKVYMEWGYFNGLRNTIASYFNVSEECIAWRNQSIICPVSDDRLKEIRGEIKREGYRKFHDNEWKREEERMKLYMKKYDIYKELQCKKTFIYKIDGKYYIISNQIFEECLDDKIIAEYESVFNEIKLWETECNQNIKDERLERQDLIRFIPQFDNIRTFCDEHEEMAVSKIKPDKYMSHNNTKLKKDVDGKLNIFLESLSQEETTKLAKQLSDMAWLCEQSIRFEIYNKCVR